MEPKFIKYKEGQVNLAKIYKASNVGTFDCNDVHDGTLVIGHTCNSQCLAMGYLRGITRIVDTGEVAYELVNAIEGASEIVFVRNPYHVNEILLPCFAATSPDFTRPIIGKILKCDGSLAVMEIGGGKTTVNVNSICELTPYFKETK